MLLLADLKLSGDALHNRIEAASAGVAESPGKGSFVPQSTSVGSNPRHVSLVALPDAAVSTLFGIYDVMNGFSNFLGSGQSAPFQIEIVGETTGRVALASGVSVDVQRTIDTIATTDIVIVPSLFLQPGG